MLWYVSVVVVSRGIVVGACRNLSSQLRQLRFVHLGFDLGLVDPGLGRHHRRVWSAAESLGAGDILVVAKGDRLARSVLVLAGLLEDSNRRGWSLVALDLGVDTSTPAGRLVIQTLGAAAEYERRMIGARTREALAAKRAQAVRLGKPSRVDAAARRRIRDVRAQGWTWQRIADALNRDGVTTGHGGATWRPSSVRAAALAAV